MDDRTFTTLELPELKERLLGKVSSPAGRRRVLSLTPQTEVSVINRELDRTTECTGYLASGGGFGLSDLADPEPALEQLRIQGTSLEATQITEMLRLLSIASGLREQFADPETRSRYPRLAEICSPIPDLRRPLSAIQGKILPTGEIDDNASPELRRIRREISVCRTRIYRNLESLMRERAQAAVQDEVVTVRNGRFVIPVKTDARGKVPGVMHGLSSSGQTSYVEPMGIIDQNNELVRLREQEEIEIAQILFALTETLRANLAGIEAAVAAITEIDFAQAKARLSRQFDSVRPEMSGELHLSLEDARHLLLEETLRNSGSAIVPVSLEMDAGHQTLVVSGPNAGGKTVVTKTVGLIALMAQMGLHVPARRAVLPVFQQVLADIGDQQSIAANLSTFTAHIRNIAEMARAVGPENGPRLPALILIDEVGTGTDPEEGAALGIAIIDYFRRAGATTIATTHYNPLKVWASQTKGVLNASVEFDQRTLRPTYRLLIGLAGASAGIEIARRMELAESILKEAAAHLSPEHSRAGEYLKQLKSLVDDQKAILGALEEERQVTADKFTRLDLDFSKKEAERQVKFERELNNAIREFNDESARLIGELTDKASASRLKKDAEARGAELRRSARVRIRKQAAAAPVTIAPSTSLQDEPRQVLNTTAEITDETSIDDGDIRERDRVRIRSLGKDGLVESISGDEYTVLAGSLRLRARRSDLQRLKPSGGPTEERAVSRPRDTAAGLAATAAFSSEINLIGQTVDEATDRIDKYLDEAFLAGAQSVRIVHGHGKGTLKRAVAEMLSGHPHVESFAPAPPKEGGSGATIVILKK